MTSFMYKKNIRIGTRRSRLAMAQAQWVADALSAGHDGLAVELVGIDTRGDRLIGPLTAVGGKGLFTAELEAGLRNGSLDMAVHSAKDMPAEMAADLVIAAVPNRADPADAIVSRAGGLDALLAGSRVGTCSVRRTAMLRALRDDLEIVPIRGNVETRLRKAVGDGAELDAAVLAMAGLLRSGLVETYGGFIHPMATDVIIPAAGQGTLAVQTAAGNGEILALLETIDDRAAAEALAAERAVLRALNADCHSCVAIYVQPAESGWHGRAMAARPDGTHMLRVETRQPTAEETAADLISQLLKNGAAGLLFN